MKIFFNLLLILALLLPAVNFVSAAEITFSDQSARKPDLTQIQFAQASSQLAESPEASTAGQELQAPESSTAIAALSDTIIVNKENYNLNKTETWAGTKFKAFDDKFVFQIDSESFKDNATLELQEIILGPGSTMAPPTGMQLASRVYQYNLKTENSTNFLKNFWFSVKYDSSDYFRKNIYYYDETAGQWKGLLNSIISDKASKIIGNFPLPYAKVAILEDISIMTDGKASWYKYKGCDCAASPDYPKGTQLKVTNVDNNKTVIVKVNDWGPDRSIHPDRVIDLDAVAFKKIASKSAGLCNVSVELYQENVALNK